MVVISGKGSLSGILISVELSAILAPCVAEERTLLSIHPEFSQQQWGASNEDPQAEQETSLNSEKNFCFVGSLCEFIYFMKALSQN